MRRIRRALGLLTATPERRLLLAALLVRLIPAWLIYGADDVQGWETWGRLLASGLSPYTASDRFPIAWPPLWLPFPWVAYLFSEASGLPFSSIAKLFPIAADLVVTLVLYSAAAKRGLSPGRTAWAWALNPVSIYTSAVHGQFDPLPALCATAAALAIADDDRPDAAAWWVSLGAAFKTWPLFILPALIAPLRGRRAQVRTSAIALTVFVTAMLLPVPFVGFRAATELLRYRSAAGWWGISGMAFLSGIPLAPRTANAIFYVAMAAAALLVIVRRTPALTGALLLLLTFYLTTPGFGPQYLVWIVPIALLADQPRALAYSALAGVILAFEVLARPFAGHLGDTIRILPHAGYARAIGGHLDRTITASVQLVLWAFVCLWWLATLRATLQKETMS